MIREARDLLLQGYLDAIVLPPLTTTPTASTVTQSFLWAAVWVASIFFGIGSYG